MTKQNVYRGVTAVQRQMVDYWCALRDQHGIVRRDAVDPGHLRSMLASISIVEFDDTGRGRFRIAGSRLRDLFGFEARGRYIEDVVGSSAEAYALGLSAAIERHGPVGGVIETGNQLHAWLRLPLAGHDGQVSQVLCHDELLPNRRLLLSPSGGAVVPGKSGRAAA
ncbi:MAG: PAS domain-containing protein [Hyphomonas sp.]|uniref:PAS domain-containing protein n=1 Tax=Hyphomonas sp. TaxID=87 RepID=UPI003527CC9F